MSKIVMYEFQFDYVKPKHEKKKAKLCYMHTGSFIFYIKTRRSKKVETRFDASIE